MCEKCVEIDKKIEGLRQILKQSDDKTTLEKTEGLIAECVAEKIGFHSTPANE
jgi:hypothetical protein